VSIGDKDGLALSVLAERVRADVVGMSQRAGTAHLASSLSCVDLLVAAYGAVLRIDPRRPSDPGRDRLILSKGHAVSSLYAVLARTGFFPDKDLEKFNVDGGHLPEQPSPGCAPGVEWATGSLGHGLNVGIGMALAGRIQKRAYRTFVLLSDGECNEGSVWEAAMFASHFKLDNLVAIIDKNGFQSDGSTDMTMNTSSLFEKWKSFGWNAIELDGHNISSLANEIEGRKINMKPTVIIAKTIKGKGVSFMENNNLWHHARLTENLYNNAVKEILSA
jgi:transketolase